MLDVGEDMWDFGDDMLDFGGICWILGRISGILRGYTFNFGADTCCSCGDKWSCGWTSATLCG